MLRIERRKGWGHRFTLLPRPCQRLAPACNALATLTLLAMLGKDQRLGAPS